MKKMKQSLGAALGGLLLLSTVLSACSGTAAPAPTGAGDVRTESSAAASDNGSAADKEAIVLKAVIKDMSADDPVSVAFLEAVSKGVSESYGQPIQLELVPISDGTYSESMGLLLQSGVIPDLIYFQGGDYQFAVTQGILEDLTPYIDASTHVKGLMQDFNRERIANYPYLLWLSLDRIRVPVVRTDWFEATESKAALLSDPSPDNYKAFFKEIKEKNSALAAYTVPGDLKELDAVFASAFGVAKSWVKDGDSYIYSKISPGEKEKLAFYASLYREGLLDNEWLSKKWDTKESAFYNGEVAVVAGTQGAVVNIYNTKMTGQNGEAAKLTVLPPAKGAEQTYLASDTSKESRGWAISALSEHKDAAFAVLEYMASPEGQILDKLGYEGEHHTKNDAGAYVLTDKISEWFPRFHESTLTLSVEFDPETPYFSEPAESSIEMVKKYAALDNAFIMPEEYAINWDAGESLYKEFAADVISGKRDIETFDAFVEEWKAIVGSDVIEYAQTAIK